MGVIGAKPNPYSYMWGNANDAHGEQEVHSSHGTTCADVFY